MLKQHIVVVNKATLFSGRRQIECLWN